jgi:hypothetical protein
MVENDDIANTLELPRLASRLDVVGRFAATSRHIRRAAADRWRHRHRHDLTTDRWRSRIWS